MNTTVMEYIKELVIALIFCAYVVMYLIEAFKRYKLVDDGRAGHWNEGLSFVIGMIAFAAVQLHIGQVQMNSVQSAAFALAPGLAFVIVTIIGSKVWYKIICWIRGGKTPNPFVSEVSYAQGVPGGTPNSSFSTRPYAQVMPIPNYTGGPAQTMPIPNFSGDPAQATPIPNYSGDFAQFTPIPMSDTHGDVVPLSNQVSIPPSAQTVMGGSSFWPTTTQPEAGGPQPIEPGPVG